MLGLWLGMSVLTIFEFVEFALDISVLAVVEIVLNASSKRQMQRRTRNNRIAPAKQSAPPLTGYYYYYYYYYYRCKLHSDLVVEQYVWYFP